MMDNYAAPQIELLRFDVYEIMSISASGDPGSDLGGDSMDPFQQQGEVEPW